MFVGRQGELYQLNKAYSSGKSECVVISGGRHVGKTALISEFIRGKRFLFFSARELTDKYNLDAFSCLVAECFGTGTEKASDWKSAFELIGGNVGNDQFILVFENYPDACLANRKLSAAIANAFETCFKDTGLFLILTGSHTAALDREILGETSTLHPFLTLSIRLKGLPFEDAKSFLSGFSEEDQYRIYNCIGGTPLYLKLIDSNESFQNNIIRLYFDRCGFIYNDISVRLQKELIGPIVYNALLRAVAYGKRKSREILLETCEESGKAHKYLNVLQSMGILSRDVPEGADPQISRKGVWRFEDYAQCFWYRYVFDHQDEINQGRGAEYARRYVFPTLEKEYEDYVAKSK